MQVKQCFKCGEEKPLHRFYRHPGMRDGRLNKCKECARKDVRENRVANLDYYREYDRARGARYNYKRSSGPKDRARNAVNNAVRDGRLSKPDECERCGNSDRIHGHHEDYSRPLEVMWLCASCHKERHQELGWGYVWNLGMDRAG